MAEIETDYKDLIQYVLDKAVLNKGERMNVVGSVLRGKVPKHDIDFLTNIPLKDVALRLTGKETKVKSRLSIDHKGMQLDFFHSTIEAWPYAMIQYTGDKMFNIHMRAHAKKLGYKLNQYGLYSVKTKRRVKGSIKVTTEKEVFELIGFEWHDPIERNHNDKVRVDL